MGDSKIVNRPLPNSRTWPILLFRLRIAGNSFAIFFISALINSWRQLFILQIWSTAAFYVELAGGLE